MEKTNGTWKSGNTGKIGKIYEIMEFGKGYGKGILQLHGVEV